MSCRSDRKSDASPPDDSTNPLAERLGPADRPLRSKPILERPSASRALEASDSPPRAPADIAHDKNFQDLSRLLPPIYVNVPVRVIYGLDLPAKYLASYVRIRGLAWQSGYSTTPPIEFAALCRLLGLEIRATHQHLSALKQLDLLRWVSPQPGYMAFSFPEDGCPSPNPVQKPAPAHVDVPSELETNPVSDSEKHKQQHGRRRAKQSKANQPIVIRLIQAGVSDDVAVSLANDFPEDYLQEKLDEYKWARAHGQAEDTGYLIQSVRKSWTAPGGYVEPKERCPVCGEAIAVPNPGCQEHNRRRYTGKGTKYEHLIQR